MKYLTYLKQTKVQILVIAIVTLLVYANSLGNGLVWDDHLFLEQWPDIQSFQGLGNVLKGGAPPSQDKIFRPVRGLIYMIDYSLWGANSFGYHLQALLIHLATTVLIYLIARRIFVIAIRQLAEKQSIEIDRHGRPRRPRDDIAGYFAFIVGLLFGTHPIHTETINYISTSMETWGTLFFFLSFYLYVLSTSRFSASWRITRRKLLFERSRELLFYIASIISAFLAFFTYEMTLTLPILIVLYDLVLNQKSKIPPEARLVRDGKVQNFNAKLKSLLIYLPYFMGVAVFLIIRTSVLGLVSRTDYLGYSFYLTMLTMVKVFARYILLLLFPINQTAVHNLVGDFPSSMIPYDSLEPILTQTLFDKDFLLAAILLVALILIAIKYIKRYPLISFCILWFFIALLPVSYIIPHGGAMAEKYLYIASFGFCLLVVYLILNMSLRGRDSDRSNLTIRLPRFARNDKNKKGSDNHLRLQSGIGKLIFSGFLAIVLIYSILTLNRNPVWKDDISLFTDVIKKSPPNLMANYTLGIWLGKANRFAEAEEAYKRAVDKAPDFWEARFNLGNVYLKMGKFDLALDEYQHSLNLNPNLTPAKNLISNIPKIKESTSSATIAGDIVLIPMKIGDLSFSFPAHWKIAESGEKVRIEAPDEALVVEIEIDKFKVQNSKFKAEDYLKEQKESYGTLINQGLAQIPNVDSAFVRVWDPPAGGQKLEFFLFQGQKVVKVLVYPANSPLIQEFNLILGSIKIE